MRSWPRERCSGHTSIGNLGRNLEEKVVADISVGGGHRGFVIDDSERGAIERGCCCSLREGREL